VNWRREADIRLSKTLKEELKSNAEGQAKLLDLFLGLEIGTNEILLIIAKVLLASLIFHHKRIDESARHNSFAKRGKVDSYQNRWN
jgi:hypothetical protein